MPKIFFATDVHGSEVCWKKFLNAAKFYGAEVLICGGDMTGKAIVPIVAENGHYTVTLGGERQAVTADQVAEVEGNIRRKGYYPLQMTVERPQELDHDPAKQAECVQEGLLDGSPRSHRETSAAPLAARPHPREQGRAQDRQDAVHQPGQRL